MRGVMEERHDHSSMDRFCRRQTLASILIFTCIMGLAYVMGRTQFDEAHRQKFSYLMGFIWALGLGGVFAVSARLSRVLKTSASRLSTLSRRGVAQGGALSAGDVAECGPLGDAAESLRALESVIQQRINDLQTELNGLNAVLSAMEEGLVVVDAGKRLLMVNAAARKILNLQDDGLIGCPLQDVARQSELLGNIELSLGANQTCSFEFQVAPQKRFVLARCSPYRNDASNGGGGRQHGAVAVLHDITELRRLERVRTEFVANVSHELRTPLTSLLGYLETLSEDSGLDPEQAQKFLGVCRRQAERLSRIVEDLLRLSRLENPQQQEIAAAEIDLAVVVNSAVDQCHSHAEERRITIDAHLPDRAAIIFGDRGLLVQALSNLIENAINYNRDGGRVTVKLRPYDAAAKQWEISVEDTGIGIPTDAMGRIFERFYRVDKARSREGGGTGLGLSIVRHIALAHGASVHVESIIDKGSTFSLRFKARETQQASIMVHEID